MPNIAEVLKAEIARISRKELRAETADLKKAQSAQKREIATLKKQVLELERRLRKVSKIPSQGKVSSAALDSDEGQGFRFSAKGLASRRQLLGLSASDFGLLLGTTGQSVYAWETGKARPRAKYLPAIAAVRALGKREATSKLEQLHAKAT